VRGVPLPLSGCCHMRIEALISDFGKVTPEDQFEVK
jgi:hypothetical protein